MNSKIVGIDIGNDVSICVVMDYDDFINYPPNTNSEDFYNTCEFYEIRPNLKSLELLLSLGDIYIFEPTGAYSYLWHDNLLEAGKEVRLLPHDKTVVMRETCNWDYKDDEHDAVALAYYSWVNLNNPRAFNRVRTPSLHTAYQKMLEKERLNKELRVSTNKAKNLLHHEFPEARKTKNANNETPVRLWGFIADENISKNAKTLWTNKLSQSIGTANKIGFSDELVRHAQKIWSLQWERAKIKAEFDEFLMQPDYQWCKPVFDLFELGTFDRVILLCQFEPFSQFLTDDLKELRLEKKRKKGKSGKCITKRVGLNKFHSYLCKAVKPWSSGKKKGHIVTGSSICRNHLYLWANRQIIKNKRNDGIFKELREQYERDMQTSSDLMDCLKMFSDDQLDKLKTLLSESPAGRVVLNLIEEANREKKNPVKTVQTRGRAKLGNWAAARISDRLVKMLFKELIAAYRKSMM